MMNKDRKEIKRLREMNSYLIKINELLMRKIIETNNIIMKEKSENKKLSNQLKSAENIIDMFNGFSNQALDLLKQKENRSEERVEEEGEEEEESVIMVKITHKRKWNSFIEKGKKRKT